MPQSLREELTGAATKRHDADLGVQLQRVVCRAREALQAIGGGGTRLPNRDVDGPKTPTSSGVSPESN